MKSAASRTNKFVPFLRGLFSGDPAAADDSVVVEAHERLAGGDGGLLVVEADFNVGLRGRAWNGSDFGWHRLAVVANLGKARSPCSGWLDQPVAIGRGAAWRKERLAWANSDRIG